MDSSFDASWPSSWTRPFLVLCALTIIDNNPRSHGYAIMSALKEELGARVTGGVIYPLLRSLEEDQLLTSRWEPGDGGPGRKEYSLTAKGNASVADLRRGWRNFSQRVSAVVEPHAVNGEEL